MVRVPKLPLSMVAVDSNTPSSISATDICIRWASLVIQLFRIVPRPGPQMAATAVDRSGRAEPGSHYRRPTTHVTGPVVTRWNGARGDARTAPHVHRAASVTKPTRTASLYTAGPTA